MSSSGPVKGSWVGRRRLPFSRDREIPRAHSCPSLHTGGEWDTWPMLQAVRAWPCWPSFAMQPVLPHPADRRQGSLSRRWPAGTASPLQCLTCTPSPERAEQDWICQTLSRIVCRFSPSAISEAGAAVSKSCLLANMSTGTPPSFSSSKSSASSYIIYKRAGWGEGGGRQGKKTFNHQWLSLIRNIFRANAGRACSSVLIIREEKCIQSSEPKVQKLFLPITGYKNLHLSLKLAVALKATALCFTSRCSPETKIDETAKNM